MGPRRSRSMSGQGNLAVDMDGEGDLAVNVEGEGGQGV